MIDVPAHITGTVWKIEKKPGDPVSAGDVLVILESMKMEMPVEAPEDGKVSEVRCKEGEHLYPVARSIPRILQMAFEQEIDFSIKYKELTASHTVMERSGGGTGEDAADPAQRDRGGDAEDDAGGIGRSDEGGAALVDRREPGGMETRRRAAAALGRRHRETDARRSRIGPRRASQGSDLVDSQLMIPRRGRRKRP